NEKEKLLRDLKDFGKDVVNALQSELDKGVSMNADFNATKNIMMNTLTRATSSGSRNTQITANGIKELTELLKVYLPEIINNIGQDIVLDDGTLVGKMIPKIDSGLGNLYVRRERAN